MVLIPASRAHGNDLRFMVRSVQVVKVYYVWTGRNAWWSTWSTRYSPGCFHTTLASAKAFCEPKRVQGTVFYIDELPSLAFTAPERVLIASEINSERFFGKLDVNRLTSITTVFPVSTMTLRQMMYVFRAESPLWPKGYPRENSAQVSFGSGPEQLELIPVGEELHSYMSHAQGANYLLGWEKRPFVYDRSVLHGIASALAGRVGEL